MPTGVHYCVAREIKRLRRKKKLSQETLADLAGLHVNTIRRLETLRYDPTLSTLNKIAQALGVRLTMLVRTVKR
jgi:transcriptional regulator with XRE-family HTH domain